MFSLVLPPVDLRVGEEVCDVGLAGGAGLDGLTLAQGPAGVVGSDLNIPNALLANHEIDCTSLTCVDSQ